MEGPTTTLLDLFTSTRRHAAQTKDPSYQPIGPRKGRPGHNSSAIHSTPYTVSVDIPRRGLQVIPAGTELVLYQDPIGTKPLRLKDSVGTLHLGRVQITLKGDGTIRYIDPTVERVPVAARPRLRNED